MPLQLDAYLGVHPQALKLSSQRNELLATNLANADTPNYKARDVDFKRALADAGGTLKMTGTASAPAITNAAHISLSNSSSMPEANTVYRVPLAPSLDGNTVDAHVEQANFAQNAVRYQATLSFLNSKFRGLMTAITGQ